MVDWLKDEKNDLMNNKRHRDYIDTAKRDKAWVELLGDVGVTVGLLK